MAPKDTQFTQIDFLESFPSSLLIFVSVTPLSASAENAVVENAVVEGRWPSAIPLN